ncbi:LOW QUALITY PROTEIN: soluble scavenger receptor cysteine-rich domain-containing protein SSC5D [Tachyglossus aculeatus]|uniref:LOW QUALITY PROTEIN: soluble scavenger receptor cysteine-rich domain-containing protein SSC5D n=1 Tax=Tachyglossus aculeatus TaxID=9261 RepID=UPI0018F6A7CD|nr:LOW QUALITY PROTEIN: soluble scavenger receptor cysteine-rich domain-containing protein SSC5D [Tachyglossus aculeatus]
MRILACLLAALLGIHCAERLRLSSGPHGCAGRLEVWHGGRWGTVCDDGWDLRDAAVACRELGCGGALAAPGGAFFGEGAGPVWLSELACRGAEDRLALCPHRGWKTHVCSHEEDAGVVCVGHPTASSRVDPDPPRAGGLWPGLLGRLNPGPEVTPTPHAGAPNNGLRRKGLRPGKPPKPNRKALAATNAPQEGRLRLSSGPHGCAGRLEVWHGGRWGTVCDDGWDLRDAAVACRELGCGRALTAPGAARFGEGAGPVWMDDVGCGGEEAALRDCPRSPWGRSNCDHSEDAGVVCAGPAPRLRLSSGPHGCAGRLEVWHGGRWGTVCDDGWDLRDAAVACRELGCGGALAAPEGAFFGEGAGPILLDDLRCRGNETGLRLCPSRPWGQHDCHHREDAGLVCDGLPLSFTAPAPPQSSSPHLPGTATTTTPPLTGTPRTPVDAGEKRGDSLPSASPTLPRAEAPMVSEGRRGDVLPTASPVDPQEPGRGEEPFRLRLVSGPGPCAGRLEIWHGGRWGTVCDDGWDPRDAAVACRELGCGGPLIPGPDAGRYGWGSGPIWLDEVGCQGTEASLASCPAAPWGRHNCAHNEDVGVICAGAPESNSLPDVLSWSWTATLREGDVWSTRKWVTEAPGGLPAKTTGLLTTKPPRTLGSGTPKETTTRMPGKLTSKIPRKWGPKTTRKLTTKSPGKLTTVTLRERATQAPKERPPGTSETSREPARSPTIAVNALGETGTPTSLTTSDHPVWSHPGSSTEAEGAGQFRLRLADGPEPCAGRLEVWYGGSWGTVCDDGWDPRDAAVACRELGCGGLRPRVGKTYYGSGAGPIWLDDVSCSGHEASLAECPAPPWGEHNCDHEEDVGLTCTGNTDYDSISWEWNPAPEKELPRKTPEAGTPDSLPEGTSKTTPAPRTQLWTGREPGRDPGIHSHLEGQRPSSPQGAGSPTSPTRSPKPTGTPGRAPDPKHSSGPLPALVTTDSPPALWLAPHSSPNPLLTPDLTSAPAPTPELTTSPTPTLDHSTSPAPTPDLATSPIPDLTTSPSPTPELTTSPSGASDLTTTPLLTPELTTSPLPTPELITSPSPTPDPTTSPSPTPDSTTSPLLTPELTTSPILTPELITSPSPTPDPTTSPSPTPDPTTSPLPTSELTTSPSLTSDPTTSPSPTPDPTTSTLPTPDPTTSPLPTPELTTSPLPIPELTTSPLPIPELTTSPSPTPELTTSPAPTSDLSTSPAPTLNFVTSPAPPPDISSASALTPDPATSPVPAPNITLASKPSPGLPSSPALTPDLTSAPAPTPEFITASEPSPKLIRSPELTLGLTATPKLTPNPRVTQELTPVFTMSSDLNSDPTKASSPTPRELTPDMAPIPELTPDLPTIPDVPSDFTVTRLSELTQDSLSSPELTLDPEPAPRPTTDPFSIPIPSTQPSAGIPTPDPPVASSPTLSSPMISDPSGMPSATPGHTATSQVTPDPRACIATPVKVMACEPPALIELVRVVKGVGVQLGILAQAVQKNQGDLKAMYLGLGKLNGALQGLGHLGEVAKGLGDLGEAAKGLEQLGKVVRKLSQLGEAMKERADIPRTTLFPSSNSLEEEEERPLRGDV